MNRIVWKYDKFGNENYRNWHHDYLQISRDYYKTSVLKSESNGNFSSSFEEEGVESTRKNISSDALLDVFALAVFLITSNTWAHQSSFFYGFQSYIFSITISVVMAGLFVDNALFSWILLVERKMRVSFNKK